MTTGPTVQALIGAASLCWPEPATATVTRRGGTTSAEGRDRVPVAEFMLIPSAAEPRLLVPAGAPAAAAASVRRYSHALAWPERLVRTALTVGLRSGLLDSVISDRLLVDVARDAQDRVVALQDWIGELLGEPVVLSLGVGTARANRKPVLQAITREGRARAFVKLADTNVARALLRQEAVALRRLSGRPLPGLQVPELIHLGPWHGTDVLVQSALATPPWTRPRRRRIPTEAMDVLVTAFDTGRREVHDTRCWTSISAAVEEITDPVRQEFFSSVVRTVADRVAGVELRVGAWHGDWAPWNMAWVGSQVRVWDWERFAEDVPAGFDPLHYVLNVMARRSGWSAALAGFDVRGREALHAAGIPGGDRDPVWLLYLVELCRRYLLASLPPTGAPLRPRTDALLRHLVEITESSPARQSMAERLPEWSAS